MSSGPVPDWSATTHQHEGAPPECITEKFSPVIDWRFITRQEVLSVLEAMGVQVFPMHDCGDLLMVRVINVVGLLALFHRPRRAGSAGGCQARRRTGVPLMTFTEHPAVQPIAARRVQDENLHLAVCIRAISVSAEAVPMRACVRVVELVTDGRQVPPSAHLAAKNKARTYEPSVVSVEPGLRRLTGLTDAQFPI